MPLTVRTRYRFGFPADDVFALYRDEALRIFPKLPQMKSARLLERRANGGNVQLRVECQGDAPIPAPLRPFVSLHQLCWTYDARFDPERLTADWQIEAPYLKDHFHARGRWSFTPRPPGSVVTFEAELDARFPVVGGLMERVVAYYVQKNLKVFSDLAERILESR